MRQRFSVDESDVAPRVADVVAHASSEEDVATVLEVAAAHDVPVTPRAGGTGRTGGAVPVAAGILLDTSAMNRIVDIDERDLFAVVEPGVITGALHEACERVGLFYPPDPNSSKSCMLGGNLAENASGPRALKYGVTRDYVLGVDVCLMGGRIVRAGRRTVKGVTGYDVTALLVGSEGTLGVFTRARLRLLRKPPEIATLMALFDSARAAALSVEHVLARGMVPRCLELLDAATLSAVRAQGVPIDARANAMLLSEVDGTPQEVEGARERLGQMFSESTGIIDVLAAQDAAQRARLWEARSMLSRATRKLAKYKLSEDVVVPRTQISTLLERVDGIGEAHGVQYLTYGHAGDGNLHVNFLWNDDAERVRVDAAIFALMQATVSLGGTLSGEHGIGITKAPYLPLEQSPELIELQTNIKQAFDPKGLLNPGKIFSRSGHGAC